MPEQLTADEQALVQRLQHFVNTELIPRQPAPGATLSNDDRAAIVEAAHQAGFYKMTQPEAVGGTAAGNLALCLLRDELASYNTGLGAHVFGPGPGVLAGCNEPLQSNYLTPLLAGQKRGSFGFTEPQDVAQPTQAVVEGDNLIVNGQKSYVTGGVNADFINTLVRIDGKPSLVVIDTDAPGVSITRKFRSLDGSQHAAFCFTNVSVPRSHIIGKPGEGMPKALGQIGDTRLAIAAQCVGLMRWTLNYLSDHLKQVDRSGAPRSDSDVVRLRFAELRIRAFAARSMLYRTARLADSPANAVNEAMYCKVFATEGLTDVIDGAIQLVGGNAVVEEHPLAQLYRQVRSLRLAEGSTDVLLGNIARGYFELGKGSI